MSIWGIFAGRRSVILAILVLHPVDTEGARKSTYSSTMEVPRIEWANLKQDVAALRQEVGKLRLENERLRRENATLERRISEHGGNQSLLLENYVSLAALNERLGQLRTDLQDHGEKRRAELIAEMSRQIVQLAIQTEEALNLLAQSIDKKPNFKREFRFSDKYPRQGLAYTVQSGDTLSQIARKFNATVQDIQNANKIADPTRLMAGETIFIPQGGKKGENGDRKEKTR